MRVNLEIASGALSGREIPVREGGALTVGRTSRASFAISQDAYLSGVHFAVEANAGACRLIDHKSANGTFLNGKRVAEAILRDGDEILAGETLFRVRISAEPEVAAAVRAVRPAVSYAGSPGASVLLAATPEIRPDVRPKRLAPGNPPMRTASKNLSGLAPSTPSALRSASKDVSALPPLELPPVSPVRPRPALTIGHWSFRSVPEGWEVAEGFGVRRSGKGVIPSEAMVSEDPPGTATTLRDYAEAQLRLVRELTSEPHIEMGGPVAVAGAEEALAALIRYRTEDGRRFVQRQVYTRSSQLFGVLTMTTLDSELARVQPTFDRIISEITFTHKSDADRGLL